jgi:hypothetical protein
MFQRLVNLFTGADNAENAATFLRFLGCRFGVPPPYHVMGEMGVDALREGEMSRRKNWFVPPPPPACGVKRSDEYREKSKKVLEDVTDGQDVTSN